MSTMQAFKGSNIEKRFHARVLQRVETNQEYKIIRFYQLSVKHVHEIFYL